MTIDLDKNLDRDAFINIETAISYSPESALCKLSYVIFRKLAQITKKIDMFRQVVLRFDIKRR